jgi:hypothetical protein
MTLAMANAKRKRRGAVRPTLAQATSARRIAAPISLQGTADLPGSQVSAVLAQTLSAANSAHSSSAAAPATAPQHHPDAGSRPERIGNALLRNMVVGLTHAGISCDAGPR